MTHLDASRLLGELDAMPAAESKRIKAATAVGKALTDAHERNIQRASLLTARGWRRGLVICWSLMILGMTVTLMGRVLSGDGLGLRDAFTLGVLAYALFLGWQLWRQRALERRLGPTPETERS